MVNNILQKHIIGIVDRGITTIQKQSSPKIVSDLLKFGKDTPEEVLRVLNSSLKGLTSNEVKNLLEKYGKNEVAHDKPPVWWIQLIRSFFNPFIAILFVIGTTSLFTDVILASPNDRDWTKVIVLSTMILLTAVLRFWQEFRSQKAAQKLQSLVQNKALVTRQGWEAHHGTVDKLPSVEGDQRDIPLTELVPGDIVYLTSGDMVPADLRLLSSKDLFVSQSALTGESMPVEKYAKRSEVSDSEELKEIQDTQNPLELNTLCFLGTNIISGSAVGVVVATGNTTYFGSMAKSITGKRPMTSFDIGINKVSFLLIRFMLVMVPIVFVINGITKGNWHDAFFFGLAVAVGLTPEMLPLIVTANLAKGAIAMAKQKVIVKKLNAIQNFGAMDILCTDKTGTITENRVVLMRYLDAEGKEASHVLSLAFLNSYFQTGLKNLMDFAVISKKEQLKDVSEKDEYQKIDEIPFDFQRRRMSVIVQKKGDGDILICKGAVEEILPLCTKVEENGKIVRIQELIHHKKVRELTKKLNEDGLRVLAVAYKSIEKTKHFYKVSDESELILAGYIGFLDPPKESAKEAIALLEQHGVKVKVITGDNEIVTSRICKEVNLSGGETLLGSEIDALSDEDLTKKAEGTTIFAKVDPLQKARIIEALKRNGHTVGFMGDGINDAAAMREADVSVSVDTAVDIAKEAADIILLQNDLLVLERGVIEGRTIFGNIMKYIKMTASSNFGNVFSVMISSIFLPFLPMLPVMILIQNLLYDFSMLSIPWDNMDREFLRKPRKWEAKGIARFMALIGPISSIFDVTTFLIMWFIFGADSPARQSLFQSGWFVEGLLSQTLIVHLIRTQKIPFIQSRAATSVLLLTGTIMALGIIFPFTFLGHAIGMQSLPSAYFPLLALTLLSYAILTQIAKILYIRKYKVWL